LTAPNCIHELKSRAAELGFQSCRIANAETTPEISDHLTEYVRLGRHGDMDWIEKTLHRRSSPKRMWPDARSAIVLAMSYGPDDAPLARLADGQLGNISVYALGRDYHDVIKGKLKQLAQWFASATGAEVKVFVDTAPLMEKPLAAAAGVGWQGKHTNLLSRELGSWFFLGVILTSADLPQDPPETDHCGTCRACLDICPTKAFPAPYQLDARRCISYLTIEHKGHIDREFREAMGNRIFGCDDCLAICPWNKFAIAACEIKLKAKAELRNARLSDLLKLDEEGFRTLFAGSTVKRTGRDRFLRNVLIAAGNSGDRSLVKQVADLLDDRSPLVRAMAVWALARVDRQSFVKQRNIRRAAEPDPDVRREWEEAEA
jgi:epoxyqueuosine reductase